MDRTTAEKNESRRRIYFGPGEVDIRVRPADGTPGTTFRMGKAFGCWVDFDIEIVELRDGNDPYTSMKPPLGTAMTRMALTLRATGQVEVSPSE